MLVTFCTDKHVFNNREHTISYHTLASYLVAVQMPWICMKFSGERLVVQLLIIYPYWWPKVVVALLYAQVGAFF